MPAIGLTFSSKCNISCAHCCFSCGPHSEDCLGEEESTRVVDEAIADPKVHLIGFSGGEALIRRKMLLGLVSRASAGGLETTLVSNGFWGQTKESATRMLTTLKKAGLSKLTLSFDDFHEEFIPTQRIANILEANRLVNLPCAINMAVTKTHTGERLIHDLGEAGYTVPITRFPVVPVGEGENLPEESIYTHYDPDDPLYCPSLQPEFHFDGKVYPCCSPAVFHTCLAVAPVKGTSVKDSISKISRNRLFAVMQHFGLRAIAKTCRDHGIGPDLTEAPVVSACDLCRKIFGDPETLRRLIPYINEAYNRIPDEDKGVRQSETA